MAATLSMVEELRRRLRERETRPRARDGETIATGLAALDALLPEGGWRAGSLVEWLAPPAAGAGTLALYTTARQLEGDRAVVVVDRAGEFCPVACAGWGVPLDRLILLRPASRREELWALEQALSCSAVASVVAWQDRLDRTAYRRLQLAAERGGGVGAILRPLERLREPSCAQTRLRVQPMPSRVGSGEWGVGSEEFGVPSSEFRAGKTSFPLPTPNSELATRNSSRRLRVECLRGRSGAGRAVEVEFDDVTATVHLAADLARAASDRRRARA